MRKLSGIHYYTGVGVILHQILALFSFYLTINWIWGRMEIMERHYTNSPNCTPPPHKKRRKKWPPVVVRSSLDPPMGVILEIVYQYPCLLCCYIATNMFFSSLNTRLPVYTWLKSKIHSGVLCVKHWSRCRRRELSKDEREHQRTDHGGEWWQLPETD